MGKITEVNDFRNIVVATPKGEVVYLSDIATVVDTTEERTSLTRLNGVNAVGLDIKKQSGSNTVQVANGIKKELEKLSKEVPADIKITLARDNSEFIKHSINDVLFDLIYGAIESEAREFKAKAQKIIQREQYRYPQFKIKK